MNREGKKCVIYLRVSTEMQVDGFSLDGQRNTWERISKDTNILMQLIDNAFKRRKDIKYDHSAPLRKNNS